MKHPKSRAECNEKTENLHRIKINVASPGLNINKYLYTANTGKRPLCVASLPSYCDVNLARKLDFHLEAKSQWNFILLVHNNKPNCLLHHYHESLYLSFSLSLSLFPSLPLFLSLSLSLSLRKAAKF